MQIIFYLCLWFTKYLFMLLNYGFISQILPHWFSAGHLRVVNTLIDAGADINLKTFDNINALYFATKSNQTDCVDILIKHGAVVNAQVRETSYFAINPLNATVL